MDKKNKFSIKVIGSGCCVPSIKRGSPAYLLKCNENKYLIDCGPGTLRQLMEAGEDYKTLTGVIFSHFHPDHTADFIPLVQALDYTPGFDRNVELEVIGPKGLTKFINGLYEAYDLSPSTFEAKLTEISDNLEISEGFVLEAIEGKHTPTSIIIKVTDNSGKGFVYSGDTGYDENIAEFARDIDLLILESSFPTPIPKHLTPDEAGEIAELAKAKRLLLTHFYPPCDNLSVNIVMMAEKYYSGDITKAEDFMKIEI